ncbi:hypothetical protein JCM10450v2_000144 [Rhodotorula kratochvilovae]
MASPRAVAVAVLVVLPSLPSAKPNAGAAPPGSPPEPTFLLVCSRKKQHLYVFPKGGVEHGESADQAAQRESWEEAGLRPDSATHLAHLLTLADPSPHILSPSSDPASPSFVSSCEYSFELFILPPPPASSPATEDPTSAASEAGLAPPALPFHASLSLPSSASSISSAASSPSASTAPSPASHPPPAPLPAHVAPLAAAHSAAYLAPEWPEARERHRRWVHGWDELERTVCWGRREAVMREAVEKAREWVGEWWARGGRPEEEEEEDGEDEEEEEEDREEDSDDEDGAKGRL